MPKTITETFLGNFLLVVFISDHLSLGVHEQGNIGQNGPVTNGFLNMFAHCNSWTPKKGTWKNRN